MNEITVAFLWSELWLQSHLIINLQADATCYVICHTFPPHHLKQHSGCNSVFPSDWWGCDVMMMKCVCKIVEFVCVLRIERHSYYQCAISILGEFRCRRYAITILIITNSEVNKHIGAGKQTHTVETRNHTDKSVFKFPNIWSIAYIYCIDITFMQCKDNAWIIAPCWLTPAILWTNITHIDIDISQSDKCTLA